MKPNGWWLDWYRDRPWETVGTFTLNGESAALEVSPVSPYRSGDRLSFMGHRGNEWVEVEAF